VFLSVCYLPGLTLLSVIKREKLLFIDIILAFPASIGISGLLTIGLLFCGINVRHVLAVIHIIAGILLLIHIIINSRKKEFAVIRVNGREFYFLLFALLITAVLCVPFFVGPNRASFGSHALHHSSFVSQIRNGIFPPENPGLGGTKIGYYWGFHALVAIITSQTFLHQIQVIYALNAISLFLVLCASYLFVKVFDVPEGYRYLFPLAVIGLMRFDAVVFFIHNMISSGLPPVENLRTQQFIFPSDVLDSWVGNLSWYDTRLFYVNKFYNVSAMPLAIGLCLSYLLLSLYLLKAAGRESRAYSIGLYLAITSCVLMYPPLAIVPLLHAPLWALFVFSSTRGRYGEKCRETFKTLMPYTFGVLTALPYLIYIMSGRDISSSGQGNVVSFAFYSQSVKNIIVFLIPSPLIAFGIWAAVKRLSLSKEVYFILIGTMLCLGLSVFTRWAFDNSYKFNYILTFFLAFFFVFALSYLLSSITRRWFSRFIVISSIFFLISTPLIVEAAFIVSSLSMDWQLELSNGHILYAQDKEKNKGYEWIRKNAPADALIMLEYIENTFPCCGNNRNYEVAAIAERNLYVIKDTDYTTSNPEYAKRVLFREKLFSNPGDPDVAEFFKSLNRPVYLLLDENPRDIFLIEDRFVNFPEDPGRPFELKFQNGKQRVYLISFK
jgi:hypothetical protein